IRTARLLSNKPHQTPGDKFHKARLISVIILNHDQKIHADGGHSTGDSGGRIGFSRNVNIFSCCLQLV
ncbi:MAG: hypothetical protein R6X18_13040, partial [Chloroflexota bacterium]